MIATSGRRRRRSLASSALVAAAVATLVAGCGDDKKKDSASGDAAKPAKFAITATSQGAKKKAMTFPSSVRAGLVTMTLTNSDTVPRSAQIVRIVGDHPVDEVVKLVTGDDPKIPDWLQDGGGVPAVKPGSSASASQVLAPGRYVILDDEGGDGDNAKTNAELGASGEFDVTGPRVTASLPAEPATVTATDDQHGKKETYGFRLEGLKAGTNQIHFQNTGSQLHHALFVPLRKGATLAQAEKVFKSNRPPSGPPPVDFAKIVGTKVIDAGTEQNITLDLPAARYAVVCFLTDRDGGKPHVAKGMIEEVDIK
jgi:hypothetical protein